MASISDIIGGLRLLAKYEPTGEDEHINGADHDIIYGGGEPLKWTDDDRAEMLRLGWHLFSTSDNYDEDGVAVLDEDAVWARFV